MPSILRNDDAEALILDIRTARHAAAQRIGKAPGAFLRFPTAVVTAGPGGGQLVFPIRSDAEPGMLVDGEGTATVSGIVAGVEVSGTFGWVAGEHRGVAPAPASYRFRRRGHDQPAPSWIDQLPSSQLLVAQPPSVLVHQQRRILRQGRAAEHWLLTLTERVVRHSCRGPIHRAIQYRPHVDVDDVVQRGMQAACRLLPIYTSQDRPPCSWLGMLKLDGRRDMHREVSRLDWLPPDSAAVVALAQSCGIALDADPSVTLAALVEAASRLGRPLPRLSVRQVQSALQAPTLVYLDSVPDAPVEIADPATPSGWQCNDEQPGRATATVARLVSDDPELIGRARRGDPRALRTVGDRVVSALSCDTAGHRVTRQRSWDEFQRSGRLFATVAGVERFGSLTSFTSLAAIDETLRRTIGMSQPASSQ